jgi:hypothetical protein
MTEILMLQRLSADRPDFGPGDEDMDSMTQIDCGCGPTLVRDNAEEADR